MESSSFGRSTRRFRELAKRVHSKRLPCIICGQPIDYRLPYIHEVSGQPDPQSKSIQHLLSVKTHPELAESIENMASAHLGCNQRAGIDGAERVTPTPTTRDW